MASNKKPRKKYVPRTVIKDPIRYIVRGNNPAEPEAVTKVKINHHLSMLAITQGKGVAADWQVVANALNAAVVLAEMGYGVEYVPEGVKAQGAMVMIRDRLKATGRMTLKAAEMQAINEALALHDEQIEIATIRDMEKAIIHVEEQLRKGNFVKVAPAPANHPAAVAY